MHETCQTYMGIGFSVIYFDMIQHLLHGNLHWKNTLKAESCHDANFLISGVIMTTCITTSDDKVGIVTTQYDTAVSLAVWQYFDSQHVG